MVAEGAFVPNDCRLDPAAEQIVLVTGPNMAGKSTYMRQVAQIVLLAQMGSFVPARAARVGVCDRLFTRVGAADDLARGDSTFMVEMRETAAILAGATRRSLVVLDEVGRGTSTFDGVSIAWAVAEYLHDAIGARTLFATHYHELCALSESRPRVKNVSVAVREHDGEIVFLRRVVPGAAPQSYGIDVARLAGLPRSVIARARQILGRLEGGAGLGASAQLSLLPTTAAATARVRRRRRASLARLEALDPDRMTPLEALAVLAELRALAQRLVPPRPARWQGPRREAPSRADPRSAVRRGPGGAPRRRADEMWAPAPKRQPPGVCDPLSHRALTSLEIQTERPGIRLA